MAELFVKHWPRDTPGSYYMGGAGKAKFILEMDEYEYANLRWCMQQVYSMQEGRIASLNNGDWAGQIRHALVEGFEPTHLSNAQGGAAISQSGSLCAQSDPKAD